jgi:alpha-tubulin suppressor-like RCC1 family protein
MRSHRALVLGIVTVAFGGLLLAPASARTVSHAAETRGAGAAPVSKLKAGSVTGTSVTLSWANPTRRGFTGSMVRYTKGKTPPSTVRSGKLGGKVGARRHTLIVGGLAKATTYSFSVFALYRSGGPAKPVSVTGRTRTRILTGVLSVSDNSNEACALFTNHRVDCWGLNINNNLGSGVKDSFVTVPVHVRAVGGSGLLSVVQSLTTDGGGFCALMGDATLDCWGDNGDGDLGQGDTNPRTFPVVVKGVGAKGVLKNVTSVAGGSFGYCATLAAGGVVCWGSNFEGALGSHTSVVSSSSPVRAVGTDGTGTLSGAASVTRSGYQTCALMTADGGLDCWGRNFSYSAPAVDVPFRIPGVGGSGFVTGVSQVQLHGDSMCAVLDGGGLDCWGVNSSGVLGTGQLSASSDTPVPVLGEGGTGTLGGVQRIVGDGATTCAMLAGGHVDCWGNGSSGQLGQGGAPGTFSGVPLPVAGVGGAGTLTGATTIAINFGSVCAVLSSGAVVCWGNNTFGGLGNGTNIGPLICGACNATPSIAKGLTGTGPLGAVDQLVSNDVNRVGGGGYYAVTSTGGVDFWGSGTQFTGVFGTYPQNDPSRYATPAAE